MTDADHILVTIRVRSWVLRGAEAYVLVCGLFHREPSKPVVDWLLKRAVVVDRGR